MDIILGDWDRHIGQWKWARFKDGKKKRWVPIPRDRDQVFSLYNGLIPWMTTVAVPQIEPFREDYRQVNDLTWSGRFLDRRFLVSIDAAAWDSVTTFVQIRLTDQVIEDAVHRMPDEWFAKEGERLIHILKMRRDGLPEISREYYEMITKYVSIYTSNKRECAEIKRLDDDRVEVLIYKKDKQTGEKKGEPFFSKTFHRDYTKEIRIDLLGGDDTAVISGEVDRSITVIITGGKGNNEIIDQSVVHGYFLSITPFYAADTKSIIYDSGKKSRIIMGPSSKLITDKPPEPKPFNPETDNINEKYGLVNCKPNPILTGELMKKLGEPGGGWISTNAHLTHTIEFSATVSSQGQVRLKAAAFQVKEENLASMILQARNARRSKSIDVFRTTKLNDYFARKIRSQLGI